MPRIGPSAAQTPGKFNVYSPQQPQQYTAYDTLAEAQADVQAHQTGVILNPAGQLDPSLQAWSGWNGYQATFPTAQVALSPSPLPGAAQPGPSSGAGPISVTSSSGTPAASTPAATPLPTAGRYHVWIPPREAAQLRLPLNGLPLTNGAYLAFNSAAEASAYAEERNLGIILNTRGDYDTSVVQPWLSAATSGQALLAPKLSTTRPANQVSIWYPTQHLTNIGVSNTSAFPTEAYLPFDSAAAALAHVAALGVGVVLDASGHLDPQQGANASARLRAKQSNAQLQAARIPGKVNVWFPRDTLGNLAINDCRPYDNAGAFLGFDSLQAAQDHVRSRDFGVVLDAQGQFDVAHQRWGGHALRFSAQLLNSKLVATKPAQGPSVWFPPRVVSQLGLGDFTAFAAAGAYLPFTSVQAAKDHVQTRDLGLILDARGKYEPSNQVWSQAASYAPVESVWPPSPVGPEGGSPSQGDADIVGVYAQAASAGAHFLVRTHSTQLNEALKYELYLTVNGSEMKVKDLGTSQMAASGYVHDASFDVSYAELNAILSALQGSAVTAGTTELSVKVTWPNGHDQGAGGAGGRGTHRFLAP